MYAQKSVVPAATGHDAKLKPIAMNLATTAPTVKLSIAEKMRVHREYYAGLDTIHAIYSAQEARAHNTADHGRPPRNEDGSRTYKMATPTEAPIAPRTDDSDCLLTRLVVAIVQSVSFHRPNGYYSIQWAGPESAIIIWEGHWKRERVALVQFDHQRALFLADTVMSHPNMVRAFKEIDFQTAVVEGFIRPSCPSCGGTGARWSVNYQTIEDCGACGGGGSL